MAEAVTSSSRARAASAITEKHPAVPLALSFCSAFVDVTCFVGLFQTFTAFITGTIIILCAELFRDDGLPWLRVTVLVLFLAGVVIWFLAIRAIHDRRRAVRICLAIESALIVLFMAAAVSLPPRDDLFAAGTTLAVAFATAAMALQNTVMVTLLPFHKPTTIMTGNFVRVIVHALELAGTQHHGTEQQQELPSPAALSTHWTVVAFIVGGVAGGACIAFVGFWGLILPAAALAAVSAMLRKAPAETQSEQGTVRS